MIRSTAPTITVEAASSDEKDAQRAAAQLVEQLGTGDGLYAVFVTAGYPRAELAVALTRSWGNRLIGCTSAGNIGPAGFESSPVLAMAFHGDDVRAGTVLIEPLSQLDVAMARARADLLTLRSRELNRESFGLVLIDGIAMQEEHLMTELKLLLSDVPLVGGSAADDLSFAESSVLYDGEFKGDRATVTIVTTSAPFRTFRIQHYRPAEEILVITKASPEERLVHEINGMRADEAFAEAINVPVADLGPEHFSSHPLVLGMAGESWVRCISRALDDGSLHFMATIGTGAVLRLAQPMAAEDTLRSRLRELEAELGAISSVLAYDCVLRRIEFERAGLLPAIGRVMAEYRTSGFSTYGEQYEDFHMNQTMVGVAFGAAPPSGS